MGQRLALHLHDHVYKLPPGDAAMLLDLLLECTDDDAVRQRILVDNPTDLFGG